MPTILCRDDGPSGRATGIYFRLLLIGYFEGLDSERGIAWRAADSLTLRDFLGLAFVESPSERDPPFAWIVFFKDVVLLVAVILLLRERDPVQAGETT